MTQQMGAIDHRLERELRRLKQIEKSDLRMIEAERRRFRMKYRKKDFPKVASTASPSLKDAKNNDPTALGLDDDHRRAAIVTNNTNRSAEKFEETDYEAVRSLIFTDNKVDLDKILCLHLLTVHVVDIDEAELEPISRKNGQSRVVCAAEESENGSSNDILPCYVVEIQRDESSQFQQRSTETGYGAEGAIRSPLPPPPPRAMPAPSAAGKIPMVSSPLLYNNLLESHARPANARGSPSLEHLLKYVHTGRMLDKSDEKMANKLQSSTDRDALFYKRSVCKKEKYFICTDDDNGASSSAPKSMANLHCRRILICFNTKLKHFVQTAVEILRNVNLDRANILLNMLKSAQIITGKLSEMADFINSLRNFSFVSVPESFACIPGYAIECSEHSRDGNFSEQPVAETLILESEATVFDNLLDDIRSSIRGLLKKSSMHSKSTDSLLGNTSMPSVPSQTNTVNQRTSKVSFGVRKSVEKIESSKPAAKSYDAIQQEFNEATSARLAKNATKTNLYTDPDRIILRRMTNSQRILVGQMCAALKTRKINREGIAKEKIPLLSLLKPVLSRESINYLTKDTIYAKDNDVDELKVDLETQISSLCINLTDFNLAKVSNDWLYSIRPSEKNYSCRKSNAFSNSLAARRISLTNGGISSR